MERSRLVGVTGPGGPGSGYAVGGRLVLTSAHVVASGQETAAPAGRQVQVFHPGGGDHTLGAAVVWCGAPRGRNDAALVLVDDDPHWTAPIVPVRWGRMVTDRPGTDCETWGVPDVAQRKGRAMEAAQLCGALNPGSGITHNQYVMDLLQHPPQWSGPGTSPWGGLSGAAVYCDRLLVGVVASDRAHSGSGQLNVVPAYVLHHDPAFRATLAAHGARPAVLEAVELQQLADPATAPDRRDGTLHSPAALLQAARQTVPFHGRRQLLDEMTAWCARDGFGAWLLHGSGGQGKTRLAHQLASLLAAERWAVLWPRADATTIELGEVRHAAKPLLVVLDYAETRVQQLAALIEAADHSGSTRLKVLLLARTGGDWWHQALTANSLVQDYLEAAPTRLLAPLEDDPDARPGAYRDAARAFAAALPRIEGLSGYDWASTANGLPLPVHLGRAAFGNALTLHMTALADLLDTTGPAARPDGPGPHRTGGGTAREQAEGVEDRLLGHERRYWRHSAATRGLSPGLSTATLETALAAAHLTGAADREHADLLWRRLPALADQPRDRRDAVTAWLTALYPAAAPLPWGTLQPDRLAERHIGRTLDADPALADRLLDGADDPQAGQLLTVYSRAAAHPVFHDRLDVHLTGLCVRRHHQLARQIITTATRTHRPAPLTTALATITTDPATALRDLTTLNALFPDSSRRLAHEAVRLAQTLTDRYRALAEANPVAHLAALATSLNNLSVRLGEVGRREEGLTAIQEAVDIRRALAEANPDAYLPALASSLNNLSNPLGEVGRREEALAAVQEAVNIRRALAKANPAAHLADLAGSLNNLSVRLGEVGRREEGLTAIQEAVDHYRALAEANPDAYLPNLAGSLSNLSVDLGDVGRREEGLTAIQEAVDHYRALAEANPDAYLPALATFLNNLSVRLGEVERREEGLTAIQGAVDIRRALAEANPAAYLPDLATSLNNLSVDLGEVERREEALAAVQEAVNIRRALAEANPAAHLPDLATSLNNLSVDLGEVERREEALAAVQEAVNIRRALAEANPAAHLPDLATFLSNLAIRLGEVERREEALAAVQEAVNIRRALAKANPAAHLPALATFLSNLAIRLGEVERREEALAAIREAVDLRRALAEANPAIITNDLQQVMDVTAWLETLPQ
ncbi:tetratricopeptide repeat protein [Streptomyces sp. NBC_01635]|uniref:tetratricopeptide repeat protein n=1 Tax=Streptomyces sp. NBC_01635 TaxID=2975904 RepID=UPI00386B3BF5|nr:tetratricopeptide repeat protein [Streptomyces sp. NBC_01635]